MSKWAFLKERKWPSVLMLILFSLRPLPTLKIKSRESTQGLWTFKLSVELDSQMTRILLTNWWTFITDPAGPLSKWALKLWANLFRVLSPPQTACNLFLVSMRQWTIFRYTTPNWQQSLIILRMEMKKLMEMTSTSRSTQMSSKLSLQQSLLQLDRACLLRSIKTKSRFSQTLEFWSPLRWIPRRCTSLSKVVTNQTTRTFFFLSQVWMTILQTWSLCTR